MKNLPSESSPTVGAPKVAPSPAAPPNPASGGPLVSWRSWLLGEDSAHGLAGFRILFGLYFLGYLLAFAPRLLVTFSSAGMTVPYLIPEWALPPFACASVYCLMLLANGAVIVGYRHRLATPLLLCLYVYFYLLNIAVKNTSHERLNVILLILLCLSPAGTVWAMSKVPGLGKGAASSRVPIWVSRIIQLQIAFLYLGAGVWKLLNPAWHNGDLLYFNFVGDWASPVAFWIADHIPNGPIWTVMSWTVIAWELVMPFALFSPRLRVWAVASGLLFHLSVWIFLGIPEFLNCVTGYVLFFPPNAVRALGTRFFRKLSSFFAAWARD